ncbi:MAG TPA: DUF6134 family protein [Steroidobacteraceae bacterium]|nr:DUF6134 family protein [Steroidobacteraceae bacterium]
MRGSFNAVVAATMLVTPLHAVAVEETTREWRFNVSVDDRRIGEHRFVLRESGGRRELSSDANFLVRILFVKAYQYQHKTLESWEGDCLARIDARTDDDGEKFVVTGQQSGSEFRLTAGKSRGALPECVQTFAYWNPLILDAQRLLNPQTGEYMPVRVIKLGRETLAGRQTERFRLIGEVANGAPLQIDLWYSPAQEWLALESRTPDGRRMRYSLE